MRLGKITGHFLYFRYGGVGQSSGESEEFVVPASSCVVNLCTCHLQFWHLGRLLVAKKNDLQIDGSDLN